MEEGPLFNKKTTVEDPDHALKCARGLYYQNKIFEKSGGKKGKRIESNSLSEEDRSAINYLRTHEWQGISPEIKAFLEGIL